MSTDDSQPAQAPPASHGEQEYQEPPTVAAPVQPGPGGEQATRAVPRYAAPPPPPPPPPPAPTTDPRPADGGGAAQAGAGAAAAGLAGAGQAGGGQPAAWQRSNWQQDNWQQNERQRGDWQQDRGQSQPGQAQPGGWQEPQDGPPGQWPPAGQAGGGGQWGGPQSQGPEGQRSLGGRRPKRRRVRRSVMALFGVIVLLIVLVIADRVACAITENEFASQIESNGLPVKPSVDIKGFPFLTQLAAKDFNEVDLNASNVPAGPVTISTVHAVINGMHISSFSSSASAHVDHMTATAFISFSAITSGLGLDTSTGITTTQDGPDKIKITAGIGGIASDTEEAQITQTGPQTISIKLLDTGGLGSLLGNGASFSFNLPKGVPASLRITNLTLNSQGLTVSAAASDATLSK